jgi:hypothetical protein
MLKILAAIAALTLASPAIARDYCASWELANVPASIKPPSVNVDVYILPRAKLHKTCSVSYRDVTACTYAHPTEPNTWVVLVSSDVPAGPQFECIMRYEQAHMPPNYWGDPKVETPETIKWLAGRK